MNNILLQGISFAVLEIFIELWKDVEKFSLSAFFEGGPCTSIDELSTAIKNKPDQEQEIVKTEMAYYCHTHKMDKIARPTLFKQNGITHEEKLENLAILLDDDNISCGSVVDLPTNEQVVAALSLTPENPVAMATTLGINELCVVIWMNSEAAYE